MFCKNCKKEISEKVFISHTERCKEKENPVAKVEKEEKKPVKKTVKK